MTAEKIRRNKTARWEESFYKCLVQRSMRSTERSRPKFGAYRERQLREQGKQFSKFSFSLCRSASQLSCGRCSTCLRSWRPRKTKFKPGISREARRVAVSGNGYAGEEVNRREVQTTQRIICRREEKGGSCCKQKLKREKEKEEVREVV